MMSSGLHMIVIKSRSPLNEERQPRTFTESTLYFSHLEKNLRSGIVNKTFNNMVVFAKSGDLVSQGRCRFGVSRLRPSPP